MATIAVDGIKQVVSSADLSITASSGHIIAKLGDAAGAKAFTFKDSSDATIMTLDSDGNNRVYGTLAVDGTTTSGGSTDVWIGDSEITLNSEITGSAGNKYGGFAIKRLGEAAGVSATAFVNATGVITCSDTTGFLAVGDLFYVVNSSKNNGLYEVSSLDASSITINGSSTVPGARLSLTDESGASASINEAIHSFVQWNASNYWEFGYYNVGAVRKAFKSVGVGAGGGVAFSNSNPDISATGAANTNSAAAFIGVYDDFASSANTTLQAVLKDFDTAIPGMGGLPGGTPNLTYSTTNSTGVAASAMLTNGTWAVFNDGANPEALTAGGTAAVGDDAYLARRDHVHAASVSTPVDVGSANASGSGPAFVRSDHVHLLGADGAAMKFGTADIGSGNSTVAVSFSTAFTACTSVIVEIVNTTDPTPFQFTAVVTAKSTSGFTATLSGAVDSANYKCNWQAFGN